MKPRTSLASTETVTGLPLELIEHDGRYFLECAGTQVDAGHLGRALRETVSMICRPFRPARQPRVIFLGLGFGHGLLAAREALPQEKASFAILPEAQELPGLIEAHYPPQPLDDERISIETDSPFAPLPPALGSSQAIVADLDHLSAIAPKNWDYHSPRVLQNWSDCLKGGGLLGLVRHRPDATLEKNLKKAGFEVVTESAPLSEKSKKYRHLYLARKGHYQRQH